MQDQHYCSQLANLILPMSYAPQQSAPAESAPATPILSFPMALRRVALLTTKRLITRWEIASDCGTMRVLGDAESSVYRAYCGTNCAQSHSLTKLANEILRVYPECWHRSWTIVPEVSWTTIDQAPDK